MLRAVFALIFCLAAVPSWAFSNQYLCIADQVVGFSFSPTTKTWGPTARLSSNKYILRQLSKDDWKSAGAILTGKKPKPTMGFFAMGTNVIKASYFVLDMGVKKFADCDAILAYVYFSTDMMRFEMIYSGSYIDDPPPGTLPDTPSITIGTCSPF